MEGAAAPSELAGLPKRRGQATRKTHEIAGVALPTELDKLQLSVKGQSNIAIMHGERERDSNRPFSQPGL